MFDFKKFKAWLEADPTRKGGLQDWDRIQHSIHDWEPTFLGNGSPGDYFKIYRQWQNEVLINDLKKWINTNNGNPDSLAWEKILYSLRVDLDKEMEVIAQLVFEWEPSWGNLSDCFITFERWHKEREIYIFNITEGEKKHYLFLSKWKEAFDQKIQTQERELASVQTKSQQEKKELEQEIQKLKVLKTDLESQLEQKNIELENAQQQIYQLKDEMVAATAKIIQLEQELDQVQKELATAQSNADSTKTEFKRISVLKEQLEKSQNTLSEEINKILQSNKDYKKDNEELKERLDTYQKLVAKNATKLDVEKKKLQKKLEEQQENSERTFKLYNELLSTQKKDGEKLQQIENELRSVIQERDRLKIDNDKIQLEKKESEEKIEKEKNKVKLLQNKIKNFREELQQLKELQKQTSNNQQELAEKERQIIQKEQEFNNSLENNKLLEKKIKEKEQIIEGNQQEVQNKDQQITKLKTDYDQANNSALQTAEQLKTQQKANQELNEEIEKLKTTSQNTQLVLTTQMITMAGENEELTNQLKTSQEQCRNLEQQITELITNYNDKTQQSQTIQQEVIQEIKPLKASWEKKLETVKGELREKVLEGSTDDYLSARELLVNIFNEFPDLNSENLLAWIKTQQNNLILLNQLKNKLGIGGETRLDELLNKENQLKDWEKQLSGTSPQDLLLNSTTAQQALQETINRQENNIKIINKRNQELQNKLAISQNNFNQQKQKLSELEKDKPITTSIETQTDITIPPPRNYWKYFWWTVAIVVIIGGGYWIYRKIRNWF